MYIYICIYMFTYCVYKYKHVYINIYTYNIHLYVFQCDDNCIIHLYWLVFRDFLCAGDTMAIATPCGDLAEWPCWWLGAVWYRLMY